MSAAQWLAFALLGLCTLVWLALRVSRPPPVCEPQPLLTDNEQRLRELIALASPPCFTLNLHTHLAHLMRPLATAERKGLLARVAQAFDHQNPQPHPIGHLSVPFALFDPHMEPACTFTFDALPPDPRRPASRLVQRVITDSGLPNLHFGHDELCQGLRSANTLRTQILAAIDPQHPGHAVQMLLRR